MSAQKASNAVTQANWLAATVCMGCGDARMDDRGWCMTCGGTFRVHRDDYAALRARAAAQPDGEARDANR